MKFSPRWLCLVLWLVLPFTAGSLFSDVLNEWTRSSALILSVVLWLGWATVVVALLTTTAPSLTVLRLIAPGVPILTAWAALVADSTPSFALSLSLANATIVAIIAFLPAVGLEFINGSSYGDEKRFPLRAPGPILFGILELVWLIMFLSTTSAFIFLAQQRWAAAIPLTIIAVAANAIGIRSCYQLTKRWLVVVPAGVVLVDPVVIVDALLVQKKNLAFITYTPAPEHPKNEVPDPEILDLTAAAIGPCLTIGLREDDVVVRAPLGRQRKALLEPLDVAIFRCSPVRPGWVMDEVKQRRFLDN